MREDRVAVNAALAYRRKRANREEHRVPDPLDHFDVDGLHGAPVKRWSVRPDQVVLEKEHHQAIENAIAQSPDLELSDPRARRRHVRVPLWRA